MKKHLKRLLASLLSLTLILGATAVTAFAVEPAESEEAITIDMEKSGFDEEAGVFNLYSGISHLPFLPHGAQFIHKLRQLRRRKRTAEHHRKPYQAHK